MTGIDTKEAVELLHTPDIESPILFHRAHKVRLENRDNKVHLCGVTNAKSGLCTEDCKFCAQSSRYQTEIETYDIISYEEVRRQGLVPGVESFQCLFGLDSDGDGNVDQWVRAGQWPDEKQVIGIRAALLLAGPVSTVLAASAADALPRARTLIGRADDCDLRVDQDGVAGRHAEVVEDGQGGLTLNHLADGYETALNGEAVQSAALASGDEIRIANCRWVLQAPGLRPEKVLTEQAVARRRGWIPWVIVVGLLGAAAAAWYFGLLPFELPSTGSG